MQNIDETIECLSDELYWRYKDIWDGYVSDEITLFEQIKGSDEAEIIANQLDNLLSWKDSVPTSVFLEKTNKIAILTDFQSRGLSFTEWITWAATFLHDEETNSA